MNINTKTWSRESAALLLAVLCWTIYQENVSLVEVIIWPFTSYAAIAFGLKRVGDSGRLFSTGPTQLPNGGRGAERSCSDTTGAGE